jgi:hypothetical protein
MRVQTKANVAPIFVTFTPNLFHHNNVRITYAGTSNFKVDITTKCGCSSLVPIH